MKTKKTLQEHTHSYVMPPPPYTQFGSVLIATAPLACMAIGSIGWIMYSFALWIIGKF